MTDFRQQIKELQRNKRVSTHKLAVLAGLRSAATLYNYLSGKTEITTANLTKVLKALDDLPDKTAKENS